MVRFSIIHICTSVIVSIIPVIVSKLLSKLPVQQPVEQVAVAAVVGVAVLSAEWLAATVGTAARQASVCSVDGQRSALGWDASATPSDVDCPSVAAGGAGPGVVCFAEAGLPNWCCRQDFPPVLAVAHQ